MSLILLNVHKIHIDYLIKCVHKLDTVPGFEAT